MRCKESKCQMLLPKKALKQKARKDIPITSPKNTFPRKDAHSLLGSLMLIIRGMLTVAYTRSAYKYSSWTPLTVSLLRMDIVRLSTISKSPIEEGFLKLSQMRQYCSPFSMASQSMGIVSVASLSICKSSKSLSTVTLNQFAIFWSNQIRSSPELLRLIFETKM